MRGKGKAKEQTESKGSPLLNTNFSSVDQASSCYLSIVEQDENKHISTDDLYNLQFELEKMLVSVVKRVDGFEKEMKDLTTEQKKKNQPGKKNSAKTQKAQINNSRRSSAVVESKPNQKLKKNNSKPPLVIKPSPVGRPKGSNQHRRIQNSDDAQSVELIKYQRTDGPSRFWDSLKPYCADITKEHIKFLEEWITPDDFDFEIPPLGNHYTSEWTDRAIKEEEMEGSKANEKNKDSSHSSAANSNDYDRPSKRIKKENAQFDETKDSACVYGPLTQRLASCLMEENIMSPLEDTIDNSNDMPKPEEDHDDNENIVKSLNLGDPVELEKRIRKNLEIAGLLDPDEATAEDDDEDDEVLIELKKVQSNHRALSCYNLSLKQKLLKLAKEEVARQELRKKLDVVDAEIIKLHSKNKSLKEKGGSLSEEDKKEAIHYLSERERLLKLIEPEEAS